MEGINLRVGAIHGTVGRYRIRGIATWIAWRRSVKRRRPRSRIKLRQTVKRNIRKFISPPVGSKRAKIMIERPVLLGHKDNVIQHIYGLVCVEGRRDRFVCIHRELAEGGTVAGARPACKECSGAGSCLECDGRSGGERCAARWATAYACGRTDNFAARSAR